VLIMRLLSEQIQNIRTIAVSIFGEGTKVFLFGSRLDDTKKGGDIDLFIKTDQFLDSKYTFELKLKFLVRLKKALGERKIDVIIDHNNSNHILMNEIVHSSIQL